MWGTGELPRETVRDAGLRDVSTQMPIAGVDDMAQGRFPRVSRHPEQCCCERQYKENKKNHRLGENISKRHILHNFDPKYRKKKV